MIDCPYCSKIIRVGGMFCSRNDDYERLKKLDSGIHVIRARSFETPQPHLTRLSINFDLEGGLVYEVKNRRLILPENRYLLLNNGSYINSSLNASSPHTTACICFRVGLAEEIHYALTQKNEDLLKNPFDTSGSVGFIEKTYAFDPLSYAKVKKIIHAIATNTLEEVDMENFHHELLETIIVNQFKVNSEINSIQRARWSTKVEIYSRLHWAKEYIRDNYAHRITLKDIASVACLSVHHFKRLFKEVFLHTPHEYLTRVRLEKARELVTHSRLEINEICKLSGFENTSSFIRLFKTTFQETPHRFRFAKSVKEAA
jgi:AraC-like DNA-binding protein